MTTAKQVMSNKKIPVGWIVKVKAIGNLLLTLKKWILLESKTSQKNWYTWTTLFCSIFGVGFSLFVYLFPIRDIQEQLQEKFTADAGRDAILQYYKYIEIGFVDKAWKMMRPDFQQSMVSFERFSNDYAYRPAFEDLSIEYINGSAASKKYLVKFSRKDVGKLPYDQTLGVRMQYVEDEDTWEIHSATLLRDKNGVLQDGACTYYSLFPECS